MRDSYSWHCFTGKVFGSGFSILKNFVKPIKYLCIFGMFYYDYYLGTKYLKISGKTLAERQRFENPGDGMRLRH